MMVQQVKEEELMGKIIIVYGKMGCGKSTFLQGLKSEDVKVFVDITESCLIDRCRRNQQTVIDIGTENDAFLMAERLWQKYHVNATLIMVDIRYNQFSQFKDVWDKVKDR